MFLLLQKTRITYFLVLVYDLIMYIFILKIHVFIVTCTTQMIPEWKIHPRKKVNKYALCEEYLLVEKVITFLAYIYHLAKFT